MRTSIKIIIVLIILFIPLVVSAQTSLPKISLGVENSDSPSDFVQTIQIVFLLTVLSLAPSILIMMTSFTRIVIIFHFLRSALATQTVPSNQILASLALFLTFFIMKPVFSEVNEKALQPYLNEDISQTVALKNAVTPLKTFMLNQTKESELSMFMDLSGAPAVQSPSDLPITTVIPAFIISEIKTAFQIGFLIYLPMLLIDIIVASTLLSMGMMMLPPIMISMPFKLLLFVLVDGWNLVVESIVKGFA